MTFRSQEIQKINSHPLLQATSLSKNQSNWTWPFLVSLTSYAVMAGECCDMFALVTDREKQFPKHEKTCWNGLRNWISMLLKELRVQILCTLLMNLRKRQQIGDKAVSQRSDCWQLCCLGPILFIVMQLSPQPNAHQQLITPLQIQNITNVKTSSVNLKALRWKCSVFRHILKRDGGIPQSAHNPRQSLPKSQKRGRAFYHAASNDVHIQSR